MMAATAKPRRNMTARPPESVRAEVDSRRLAGELASNLRGEVRFDAGSRALYAKDYSVYRHLPIGVVIPRDIDDVVTTVEVCRRYGAPILARGCGTSPNGQCCNVAVVMDCSKYLRTILQLDPERRVARVQPGVVCDQLRDAAERHQLTFGPDPATHAYCTLGGMIGNNSCGTHSVMAGQTVDNIQELEVLTYDGLRLRVGPTSEQELERIIKAGGRRGEIYARLRDLRDRYGELVRQRYPKIPRRCSGYNLDQLLPENGFQVARALVGTESTCVTLLEATARLVPSPQHRRTVVFGYPDRFAAGDHVPAIMAHGPIGLEGFDTTLTDNMQAGGALAVERSALPEGNAWLLAEFGADSDQAVAERASAATEELGSDGRPLSAKLCDADEQLAVWAVRQAGVDYSNVPGVLETEGTWEDAAVPPERLGDYLRDFDRLLGRFGYRCVYYGHFGQGCVHTRIDFDLKTSVGLASFRSFLEQAADLVVGYGGSIAGEYGEGQRGELLPRMFGSELVQAFREFKAIWDPDGRMNPGKVVDPYPLDRYLRFGAGYSPPQLATHFRFPKDKGSFAVATERCFGIGRCRKTQGGTMCPSYMVTREEMHTTRGRANLLFELLQPDAPLRGWRDRHVKQALDLCLACKACKAECPVQVDIATYKAEFLAHYYQRRLRPPSAYAIGLVPWWARLAGHAPRAVNALTQTPLLAGAVKRLVGLAPQRPLPRFAAQPFRAWFAAHEPRNPGGPRVLLWPDTFTNYFRPQTGQAAVEILEAAGCRVELPSRPLCCGRPLYDYGMLSLAKRWLGKTLETLAEPLAAGVPVVVLEPSCAAVFRDELGNLLPTDERAIRLGQQTLLLSEFLQRQANGWQPPKLHRKAVVQGHCHHKAIMKLTDEQQLLARLGLDAEVLDAGCCGLAGSFGYERGERYQVSMKAGERVLLPAVREAAKDTLIIADGFSCQEQIAHGTDRRALHLAQVLQLARRYGQEGPPGDHPEQAVLPPG
jgi:FAD/FMN-containing dehydrogenase/Fe-S oxidoreductase